MAKSLLRTNEEIAEIYDRHVNTVYRICFTYLKNSADTEDVVQNTFVKLMNYGNTFKSIEHEKAWLIVTATNLCKDFLRHWWRKRNSIENYDKEIYSQAFETDETITAVMELPDKYKTAIYLYYYEGYTSVEISALLKKPQSTIRNYLHEGRNILRQKLGGDFHEE
ncbi:MAG: polymerase sigma factor [Oscillospiraceae bacterium]|jgi:RNA polymerase sigma-70 factor (ECF subfamily)|nr:polymerase sigma factor [Oscillospiraceae bacterium]